MKQLSDYLYYSTDLGNLYCGDCLEIMPLLTEKVDLILCDLPYGISQIQWDSIIPFELLWDNYLNIIRDNGVIVLTASQPFTSMLVMSNIKMFKHEWIWIKNKGGNFMNTKREPIKEHESILIFSKGKYLYNKQMQKRTGGGLSRSKYLVKNGANSEHYNAHKILPHHEMDEKRVPSSWQKFNTETGLHPTQKPVALFEYLIKTYTNENDLVLDNCIGSGTTAVACINTNRKYIGIEISEAYCKIAKQRISAEANQTKLNLIQGKE